MIEFEWGSAFVLRTIELERSSTVVFRVVQTPIHSRSPGAENSLLAQKIRAVIPSEARSGPQMRNAHMG